MMLVSGLSSSLAPLDNHWQAPEAPFAPVTLTHTSGVQIHGKTSYMLQEPNPIAFQKMAIQNVLASLKR